MVLLYRVPFGRKFHFAEKEEIPSARLRSTDALPLPFYVGDGPFLVALLHLTVVSVHE